MNRLTSLTLRVKDLETQLSFYRDLLGFSVVKTTDNRYTLELEGQHFQLLLEHDANAPVRPQPTLGLYHLALLLPDRLSLGRIFRKLAESRYPHFQGASDHLVSEAIYLADPEGNGIELYRDRPSADWKYKNGAVMMGSEALDLNALFEEAGHAESLHPQTTFGHLHLHVADLVAAQTFFENQGMKLMLGDFPSAKFLSWDQYHHHIGINLWAKGRTAPAESTGLIAYGAERDGQEQVTLLDPNAIPMRVN